MGGSEAKASLEQFPMKKERKKNPQTKHNKTNPKQQQNTVGRLCLKKQKNPSKTTEKNL
jgi:hypothetical protein